MPANDRAGYLPRVRKARLNRMSSKVQEKQSKKEPDGSKENPLPMQPAVVDPSAPVKGHYVQEGMESYFQPGEPPPVSKYPDPAPLFGDKASGDVRNQFVEELKAKLIPRLRALLSGQQIPPEMDYQPAPPSAGDSKAGEFMKALANRLPQR